MNIKKWRQVRPLVIAVVGAMAFIFLDVWFADKEIVIQSPFVIRQKILSPVNEREWEAKILEDQIRKEVEEEFKNKIEKKAKEVTLTLPEAHEDVLAKEGVSNTDWIEGIVEKWADEYGVDKEFAKCVAFAESSYNPLAVGDSGKARGLYQFWIGTWEMFREKMGESTTDFRVDPDEAAKTAMWAISQGYGSHWSVITNGTCRI